MLPLLFHGTGGQLGNSGQDAHELFAGDGFFLVQVLGDLVQLAAVFNQHLFGFFMLLLDDFHDLIVHCGGCALTAGQAGIAAQVGVVHSLQRDHVEILAHAVTCDHRAGELGRLLDVVGSARGDRAEADLLGGAAAHNVGQMAAAVITLGSTMVLGYLPFLLAVSLVTGTLTGFVTALLLRAAQHIRFR